MFCLYYDVCDRGVQHTSSQAKGTQLCQAVFKKKGRELLETICSGNLFFKTRPKFTGVEWLQYTYRTECLLAEELFYPRDFSPGLLIDGPRQRQLGRVCFDFT